MKQVRTRPQRSALLTALLVVALAAALLPAGSAAAAGGVIRPGAVTRSAGAQCTANFVFVDRSGERYLGQAAHCARPDRGSGTDGCRIGSLPLGTPVEIDGASRPGVLAYSSWETMHRIGERDADACRYNDFALVRIHPDDHDIVDPTFPVFGGPTGLAPYSHPGDEVYSYGNSSLRPADLLNAKRGTSQGTRSDGWAFTVYTLPSPGIPGDSGSGYLDPRGRAVGVLSTIELAPRTASNTVVNLAKALEYLHRHSDLRVHPPTGWRPFAP